MTAKRSVPVRIRGKEFRVLSEDDETSLREVAGYVDATMAKLEERTGTVDSLEVALLTALNLARELMELRAGRRSQAAAPRRMRALIELAESTVRSGAS